jgi:predicted permease
VRLQRWLYTLPLRWRSIARRRLVERDLDDEIQYHLESQVDDRVARGMDRAAAWRAVLREFGGPDLAKERCRDTRHMNFVDALAQDLRYAARTLRRNPGFAAAAILTLALGIGANTAVFSLVDGILLARLPYLDPDRLVSVTGTYPNGAFAAMRDESRTLDVAAYAEGHWFTLQGDGEPVRLAGTRVSAELLALLGVEPALGRWFRAGEDLAPRDRVVVLSHALWVTRFRGDPRIVGRSIELDTVRREVVGVMPAAFRFPSSRTQIWVPLGIDARNSVRHWAGDFMPVVGRLRPGASLALAHDDVRAFQSRIAARFPWKMPPAWNQNVTVVPLQDALVGGVRSRLLILIAAVALVLAIACANVANLSLSSAAAREREIAIRTAIGAGPQRIARQLFTESVLLASLGAIVGLVLATQLLGVLKVILPPDTPRLDEVHLNWRVLAFTAGLAVLTGCSFGVAPVLQALRLRLRVALDAGGRSGGRAVAGPLRAVLTTAQIACAVLLVIAAGLLVRSLWTLSSVDPGFRSNEIVTAHVSAPESTCGAPERCITFYRTLETRTASLPGVQAVALVNTLPLTGAVAKRSLELEGHTPPSSQPAPLFWLHVVTPDYFQVMDIRLESGRGFTAQDLSGRADVAIIASSSAQRFWPDQNPIGRLVRFVGERQWRTIVGVVSDVRAYDLTRSVPDWIAGTLYVPHAANATMEDGRVPTDMFLTLRTSLNAGQIASMLRLAAGDTSAGTVIGDVKDMRALLADAVAAPAATTSLLAILAGLAVVLGCIGVYGVLSFLVSRQLREFGIRLALGAQPGDVFWLVLKEGATLCVAGIVIGVVAAMGATRWLSSELHGVSPLDPLTYAVVTVMISLVTLLACYVPTRRAMGVDPVVVLREP